MLCKYCNKDFVPKYVWQIYCKDVCRKNNSYEKRVLKGRLNDIVGKFGMSGSQYNQMVKKQKNLCAICFKKETSLSSNGKKIKNLAVDHCHKTNVNRGLLCQKCNIMIGQCNDSIKILKSAIRYINKQRITQVSV